MTVIAFNSFDMCVLGILALSCLFAFFRGLVREILSLVAWIGAGMVTIHYFPVAAEYLSPHFKSPAIAAMAAMILLYIAALIGFSIINMVLLKTIKGGGDGGALDNVLGLLFGAVRGALIISLFFFVLGATHLPEKEYPEWLKTSATRPYGEAGAAFLMKIAPEYAEKITRLEKKAQDEIKPVHLREPDEPFTGDEYQKQLREAPYEERK